MNVLDSLISQWRRCGGDKCRLARHGKCKRCKRGARITAERAKEAA
ncbi:hypothetical protein I552_10203 [Mycobacterium xenopi 3993]|nr:hypothetical protein I552_9665 [Mycobacterium xenopi 3993]EUA31240.1 hypothetical protein I552_10203 [Mycobacterium xenopi 3993]